MPKVKRGQDGGTKGPKRKRNEQTRDVGSSSAQAESLSEEVPQMMAPVTLHDDGLDAAPIPDMSLSVIFKHENVTLTLDNETVVKSPGYPNKKYEQDTIYTWDVTAPATTEKISINVKINIHKFNGPCQDYLQIQEINPSSGNFTVFKRCGNFTCDREANGNRLLITLLSNYDTLTSSGFQLRLKVVPSTTITTAKLQTLSTTTPSTTTLFRTTPSTTTTSTTATSTTTPSTTATSTTATSTTATRTSTPSTTTPSTTAPPSTTTTSTTTSTPKLTTTATSLTTTPTTKTTMTPNTNATTSIKSMSPLTLMATRPALITSDENRTRNNTTPMNTITDKDTTTSFWDMFGTLEKKTVILLIGLGVLEVTLIVVGVLAVQRYRRKRKYCPSRQARRRNDIHTNPLQGQNRCEETHVYDEIDIDNVKEEEENQYKELPEGVYDTTLKRRSHLKVTGKQKPYHSRGSIIDMFRTSSFFRRKVNENSVMTFSSFKGPIQTQSGERNNQ